MDFSAVDLTSNLTDEEKLEKAKARCERLCDMENNREGSLVGYDCRECKNKGYLIKPQLYMNNYQEVQVNCKCMKIRKTLSALRRSGLEDVVHKYTFQKYIITEEWQKGVMDIAQRYLKSADNSWFFYGGTSGCGKTHICTAIAISLLKRGNEVKYMLWRDEASRLKARVNDVSYGEFVDVYKNVDVLYIDDFFKTGKGEHQSKQRPTPADINLAFEILNSRVAKKKITIISSECTLADIVEIDEAVAGRIKEMCGEHFVNVAKDVTKNYRLRGTSNEV